MDKITNYEMANVVNEVAEPIESDALGLVKANNEAECDELIRGFSKSVLTLKPIEVIETLKGKETLEEEIERLEELEDEIDSSLDMAMSIKNGIDDVQSEAEDYSCDDDEIDVDMYDTIDSLRDAWGSADYVCTTLDRRLTDVRDELERKRDELEEMDADDSEYSLEELKQSNPEAFINAYINTISMMGYDVIWNFAMNNDIRFNGVGEVVD